MFQTMPHRSQHSRLMTLLADLEARLDPAALQTDPAGLAMKTMHLVRWVQVHHAFEQASLFQPIRDRATPAEQRAADRYRAGLDRLEPILATHDARWTTAAAIAAEPQAFVAATLALGQAIRERIDLEEQHLYPLFEGVMARDAAVRDYLEA